MEIMTSLRDWAVGNKVWELSSWESFLRDLSEFYKKAYTLNELYKLLNSSEVVGRPSLADIEDEDLREKIRVAIYGGVERDPQNSFARFMYEHFGICAEQAPTFEESIKQYRNWGDGVKVSVLRDSWISGIPINELVEKLRTIIRDLSEKLGKKISDWGINDSYPYEPTDAIDVRTLLPKSGEDPGNLISIVNDFKQGAADLAIGANPFMTFIYYVRAIPVPALMEFLDCDIKDIARLADFLGLKAYSTVDLTEVRLPTDAPDKVFLLLDKYGTVKDILGLQMYLERVEPTAGEIFDRMVEDAVDQIRVAFEPWELYEPIFTSLSEILGRNNWCRLEIEGGLVKKISYPEAELSGEIWFRDLLMKLYPAISTGIVSEMEVWGSNSVQLYFSPHAKTWIEKVIENEGKA